MDHEAARPDGASEGLVVHLIRVTNSAHMVFNTFPFLRTFLNYPSMSQSMQMAKLSDEQIDKALVSLKGWRRDGDYITKEFHFRTFLSGIRFVDEVALVAEAQEHHPDICVVWTTVTLKITTHDEGGITKWDFGLAKAIEKRFAGGAKKPPKSSKTAR